MCDADALVHVRNMTKAAVAAEPLQPSILSVKSSQACTSNGERDSILLNTQFHMEIYLSGGTR